MSNPNVAIAAAWYVPAGAMTQWYEGNKMKTLLHGKILARDLDDRIYTLKTQTFADPKALLKRINDKGIIDLNFWDCTADDSEASRYFDDRQFD